MKTSRWFVTGLLLMFLVVGLSFTAQSGVKVGKAGKLKAVMPCPSGWKMVSGSYATGQYTCKPKKPKPIKCPGSSTYFETECSVGCLPPLK